ncbi:MAG: VOC family protein [Actinobacteria bacterium]|nr:VOC family protein [Actinomycetota bacterium]
MGKTSVRYVVDDIDSAIAFYTTLLGFEIDMNPGPGFAALERGDLRLLLNVPGSGGAGQATPRGVPESGGWNRFQLQGDDLATTVQQLRDQHATFDGEIVTGKGGQQILLMDPAGNPIELFEPFSA